MKLPLEDESGQGETQSRNGPESEERTSERTDGNDSSSSSGSSSSGSGGVQPNGSSVPNGTSTGGSADPDFSEYLWMEHEEEFDEQVLKELEDEEMINYYFELYEASMEEEARKRNGHIGSPHPAQNGIAGRSSGHPHPPNYPPACSVGIPGAAPYAAGVRPPYRNQQQRVDDVEQITRGLDRVNFAGASSRLNPNAAEFVPRTGGGQSVSVNANSDSDSRPTPDTQPC
jgi:hypothetical protein